MKNRKAIVISIALLVALLCIGSASAVTYKKPLPHKPAVRGTLIKDMTPAQRRRNLEGRIGRLKKKLKRLERQLKDLKRGRMQPRN